MEDAARLPNNSQFKCYDGMHNWNQLQPAPYDGMYQFPSVIGRPMHSGRADRHQLHGSCIAESCTICDPDSRRHADAARRQVRGRNGRSSGL